MEYYCIVCRKEQPRNQVTWRNVRFPHTYTPPNAGNQNHLFTIPFLPPDTRYCLPEVLHPSEVNKAMKDHCFAMLVSLASDRTPRSPRSYRYIDRTARKLLGSVASVSAVTLLRSTLVGTYKLVCGGDVHRALEAAYRCPAHALLISKGDSLADNCQSFKSVAEGTVCEI